MFSSRLGIVHIPLMISQYISGIQHRFLMSVDSDMVLSGCGEVVADSGSCGVRGGALGRHRHRGGRGFWLACRRASGYQWGGVLE